MGTEQRPTSAEREIGDFTVAEIGETWNVLRREGIRARILGDPESTLEGVGDPWTDRMAIAVPKEDVDRSLGVLQRWNEERAQVIKGHSKGLWRVALRTVALLAFIAVISMLAGGFAGDYPTIFTLLCLVIVVTVILDLILYVQRRRARRTEAP